MDLRNGPRTMADPAGAMTAMTGATVLRDKDRGRVETNRVCL